jgi:hypothetical protein
MPGTYRLAQRIIIDVVIIGVAHADQGGGKETGHHQTGHY